MSPPLPPPQPALEPYLNVRNARLLSVTRDETSMLVITRLGETSQVHRIRNPLGIRQQVTFHPTGVERAALHPQDDRLLYFLSDPAGSEVPHLYRLDRRTGKTKRLTEDSFRVSSFRFLSEGKLLLTGNDEGRAGTGIYRLAADGSHPPEPIWVDDSIRLSVFSITRDGKKAIVQNHQSYTRSSLGVLDLETGAFRLLSEDRPRLVHKLALFSPDQRHAYVATNADRDFVGLYRYSFAEDRWEPLLVDLPWDVEAMALSGDGRHLVVSHNVDGVSRLSLVDTKSTTTRGLPGIPKGVVTGLRFANPHRLAFSLSTPTSPMDVHLYDLVTSRLIQWTDSARGGLLSEKFVRPERVRIRAADGLEIPCWIYRPRSAGPHPVLIWLHGGPEAQLRPKLHPMIQFFAVEQETVVVAPDVRGSSGYGLEFLKADDGVKRADVVKDVGSILSYIENDPEMNAQRIGAHGVSYGGFLALAALAEYPERFRAGSSQVGIANLVSFLHQTSSHRVARRRLEYGDEREQEIRHFLRELSPVSRVADIRAKIFIAHGLRDSRIPVGQAEEMISTARKHGLTVWHMLAPEEGHLFTRTTTRNTHARLLTAFFGRYL